MLPEEMIDNELRENSQQMQIAGLNIDYSEILKEYGLEYSVKGHYLQVGEITQVQGWILHLPVVISQVIDLIHRLLPVLISEKMPFKIPVNGVTTELLLGGMLGYVNLGKIVTVYPDSDEAAIAFAQKLIVLTEGFNGPDIPTDIHLGSVVYTRYGSFSPVLQPGAYGLMEKYIYDYQGQLILDNYCVPFILPEGVSWPFSIIKAYYISPQKKLLNDCIKPLSIIKHDIKGRVIKGLYLKSWFQAKYCVVKEGRKYMVSDAYGHDIRDRLEWQYQLHNELSAHIPIPKVIDRFTENGDLFLAMEYIDGISLDNKIITIYDSNSWVDLSIDKRLKLLSYLLDIIQIVHQLHEKGYVHRDLTPANFLVNKKDQVFIIDLELTYNRRSDTPHPPFGPGTDGYMSPEQAVDKMPGVKEDVYGLGALMIIFFTCLPPSKFETTNLEYLQQNLYFFIPEPDIVNLVSSCLYPDPKQRPDLSIIRNTIDVYRNRLCVSQIHGSLVHDIRVDEAILRSVINNAIRGIGSSLMTQEDGLWFSKVMDTNSTIANQQLSRSLGPGLFEGVSGVLYMLSRLKASGIYPDADIERYYQVNFNYIRQNYVGAKDLPASLCAGTTGIGLMLATGMECGLIRPDETYTTYVHMCMEREPSELNLIDGAAGLGLSILQCMRYLPEDFILKRLSELTTQLLDQQQKNGIWMFPVEKGEHIHMTGFGQGSAGIVCFLLMAGFHLQDDNIKNAAIRGLLWYQRNVKKRGSILSWPRSSKTKDVDPWALHGIAGITLMFIKAYEFLGVPAYKKIVEAILNNYPLHISSRYLGHAYGLTGLGEIYLEASRVLKNEEWKKRADWIALTLMHQTKQPSKDVCYWLTDAADLFPTADLITGNSGIIYFLARSLAPNKLPYPLFPAPYLL